MISNPKPYKLIEAGEIMKNITNIFNMINEFHNVRIDGIKKIRNVFDVIDDFYNAGKDPAKVDEIKKTIYIPDKVKGRVWWVLVDYGESYHAIMILEKQSSNRGVEIISGYLLEGKFGIKYDIKSSAIKTLQKKEGEDPYHIDFNREVFIIGPLKKR